ncbi:MAG: hypothetical protein N2C14_15700, partial [Planctomycetales bacterium]
MSVVRKGEGVFYVPRFKLFDPVETPSANPPTLDPSSVAAKTQPPKRPTQLTPEQQQGAEPKVAAGHVPGAPVVQTPPMVRVPQQPVVSSQPNRLPSVNPARVPQQPVVGANPHGRPAPTAPLAGGISMPSLFQRQPNGRPVIHPNGQPIILPNGQPAGLRPSSPEQDPRSLHAAIQSSDQNPGTARSASWRPNPSLTEDRPWKPKTTSETRDQATANQPTASDASQAAAKLEQRQLPPTRQPVGDQGLFRRSFVTPEGTPWRRRDAKTPSNPTTSGNARNLPPPTKAPVNVAPRMREPRRIPAPPPLRAQTPPWEAQRAAETRSPRPRTTVPKKGQPNAPSARPGSPWEKRKRPGLRPAAPPTTSLPVQSLKSLISVHKGKIRGIDASENLVRISVDTDNPPM